MTTITLRKPRLYFSKINEIASFVVKPKKEILNDLSTRDKIKEIVALYLIKLLIGTFLILIFDAIFNINNSAAQDFSDKYPPLIVLFLGGILTPLIEEATFRLSIFFKPIFLSISIGLLTLIIYSQSLDTGILKIDESVYLRYSISLIIGILTYYITVKNKATIKNFWNNHVRWIYYFSAISFGFAHFGNFDLDFNNLYLIPLLTLPHIIGGIFFGYVRIKHGFLYGFAFHSLNNMIALSLALLI